jgi:hypothetical protein
MRKHILITFITKDEVMSLTKDGPSIRTVLDGCVEHVFSDSVYLEVGHGEQETLTLMIRSVLIVRYFTPYAGSIATKDLPFFTTNQRDCVGRILTHFTKLFSIKFVFTSPEKHTKPLKSAKVRIEYRQEFLLFFFGLEDH